MDEYVDVLLATYNGEKYIKDQLESILNQTYKKIHIYVSDDNSTDNTQNILKEYEAKYDNIFVTYQEKNIGSVRNFEFLMTKVKDAYYMLSDQDDVWYEDKVEKSLKKLNEENADLVFTDLKVVDENLKSINKSFYTMMGKIGKINKSVNKKYFEYLYNSVTGCTILSKSSFIDAILPLPKNSKYVIHDSWIGLITSLNGKIVFLNEPTIKYRQHGNNQIGTNKRKYESFDEMRNLFIEVKLDLFKTYLENNDKFPEELKKLNKNGNEYFERIKLKRNFNFRKWCVFHKLYKNEEFSYYMKNFVIMNMPFVGRMLFKLINK